MSRFVEGQDRQQVTLLPECLDDFIAEDNPVRVVDAFVAELDLGELGFEGVRPADTGRPSYHPAVLLKIYIYGYLNRVQSSRRLEHECQRNVELMWLTGRLAPDFKTIADFRHDNGAGIRNVCRRFVVLCRELKLFSQAAVAVDSSKLKAVSRAASKAAGSRAAGSKAATPPARNRGASPAKAARVVAAARRRSKATERPAGLPRAKRGATVKSFPSRKTSVTAATTISCYGRFAMRP